MNVRSSVLLLMLCCAAPAAGQTARVTVEAGRAVGPWKPATGYFNTSLRKAPPPGLADQVKEQYGRARITRVWLPLDDMWDYRTGEYRFNFQCGKDYYAADNVKHKYERDKTVESNVMFYDYMDAFSRNSDRLLLNVRRYEHEVTRGIIPIGKWKEVLKTGLRHYKQRYANLSYIEVLNEAHVDHFGGLDDDRYYGFYRVAYQVVNELNLELKPAVPLLVGGPSTVGTPMRAEDLKKPPSAKNRTQRMYRFLTNYAQDSDPGKRLDFLSFHDYGLASEPSRIATYDAMVRGWLKDMALPTEIPIFETEIGAAKVAPEGALNLRNAAGMSAFFYHTRHNPNYYLFPWVLYHNPVQLSVVQFDERLRPTPSGAALLAWSMHKEREVTVSWENQPPGSYAVATADGSGLAVQVWNFAEKAVEADVVLNGAPARAVRMRRYVIDSRHSNCLQNQKAACALETVSDHKLAAAPKSVRVQLEPFALSLLRLDTEQ
ncbi:MAG: hypothetical protein JNL98_21750 [Bryobacterales bacterium]|nr:hypothetical protein [Bryobacterales bacterium]